MLEVDGRVWSYEESKCGGLDADPVDLVLCWLVPGVAKVEVRRSV